MTNNKNRKRKKIKTKRIQHDEKIKNKRRGDVRGASRNQGIAAEGEQTGKSRLRPITCGHKARFMHWTFGLIEISDQEGETNREGKGCRLESNL